MKVFRLVKKLFLGCLSIITFIVVVGFVYEQISRSVTDNKFPPQGEFLDVGGHKLHYIKKGTGSPTVIFDSGLGEGVFSWAKVQNEVSEHVSTISYDRAGISWSERGGKPKSGKQISTDLHELLVKAEAQKPYIIVAHSMSGLTLRGYISDHKEDIFGVIFVDVSHPDQINRFPKEAGSLLDQTPAWLIDFSNAIGVVRLLFNQTYPNTEVNDPINIRANALRSKSISATVEESRNFKSLAKEAASISTFENTPLVIITGESPERFKYLKDKKSEEQFANTWSDLQKDLLRLSNNSKQILATKSGHLVQMEQPEVIIKSIKEMIAEYNPQQQDEH